MYGWPEEFHVRVIKYGEGLFVAPLAEGGAVHSSIDKSAFSVLTKVAQLYESMANPGQKPKVVIVSQNVNPDVRKIATVMAIKIVGC